MRRLIFLGLLLLAACSNIPEPTATIEPTATDVLTDTQEPTATFTPEPTETQTVTPTPEVIQELPLEWLAPFYTDVAKKVDYRTTMSVEPCRSAEYAEYGDCVTDVNFCPSGECEWFIIVLPFVWEEMPDEVIDLII